MKTIENTVHRKLFEAFVEDNSCIRDFDEQTLFKVVNEILYRKVLKGDLAAYRTACSEELDRRAAEILDYKKSDEIFYRLTFVFHLMEILWKDIASGPVNRRRGKMELYQRVLGLAINDLTSIKTGIWSVNALRNKILGKDKKLNTDEHYCSLYAHASAEMLLEALDRGVKFDINHFAALVFKNNQTVRTTVKENTELANYHRDLRKQDKEMVSPQHSYDAVGVSELVVVDEDPTRVRRAWNILLDKLEVEPTLPPLRTISLEEAFVKYPDLVVLKKDQPADE